MKIGFIGLGNVGGKLAATLLRNGYALVVRDLNEQLVHSLVEGGAAGAASPRELAQSVDLIITCLPSPAASAEVLEGEDGLLAQWRPGQIWLEMRHTE